MYSGTQHPPSRQRGVVLIFTLIILLILTIGAVALMRSMNTSLFGAGNLAFRRDLANQGEQAVSTVLAEFSTGGALVNSTTTQVNVPADNYSATMLATNSQGMPNALLSDPAWAATNFTGPDLVGATGDVIIRYAIDRLCNATGPSSSATCVQSTAVGPSKSSKDPGGLPSASATVYRLSVRITGPRSTQVFLQTTFTKPD
jgi:type IV pilus assembly protein PilX